MYFPISTSAPAGSRPWAHHYGHRMVTRMISSASLLLFVAQHRTRLVYLFADAWPVSAQDKTHSR